MRGGRSLQHILGAHITPGPDAAPGFFFLPHILLRFLILTPTSLLSVHCHPILLPESSQICPHPQWKPPVMFVCLFSFCCSDRKSNTSNIKKRGFILVPSFRGFKPCLLDCMIKASWQRDYAKQEEEREGRGSRTQTHSQSPTSSS